MKGSVKSYNTMWLDQAERYIKDRNEPKTKRSSSRVISKFFKNLPRNPYHKGVHLTLE